MTQVLGLQSAEIRIRIEVGQRFIGAFGLRCELSVLVESFTQILLDDLDRLQKLEFEANEEKGFSSQI